MRMLRLILVAEQRFYITNALLQTAIFARSFLEYYKVNYIINSHSTNSSRIYGLIAVYELIILTTMQCAKIKLRRFPTNINYVYCLAVAAKIRLVEVYGNILN